MPLALKQSLVAIHCKRDIKHTHSHNAPIYKKNLDISDGFKDKSNIPTQEYRFVALKEALFW